MVSSLIVIFPQGHSVTLHYRQINQVDPFFRHEQFCHI